MAIIMIYHDLVERDSKYVDRCWKTLISWILAALVCSTLFVGFSFHSIFIQYNSHCIINADLVFNNVANNLFHLTNHYGNDGIYQNLQSIDMQSSKWGNKVTCDYMSFIPLFEAMCGTIWFFLFLLCGHGGRGSGSIVIKPWRIVMPAIVFFAIMTILAFIYLVVLFHYLNQFCLELSGGFISEIPSHQSIDCGALINAHALNTTGDVSAYTNYVMLNLFTTVTFLLWLLALLIMICRVVFVVDFQLIRVTISTLDDSVDDGVNVNLEDDKLIKKVQIVSSAAIVSASKGTVSKATMSKRKKSKKPFQEIVSTG